MTLKDWLSSGWLKQHATSRKETADLLAKVDRDITEAGKEEITLDWRLAIAYNACLGCAIIALRGERIPDSGRCRSALPYYPVTAVYS